MRRSRTFSFVWKAAVLVALAVEAGFIAHAVLKDDSPPLSTLSRDPSPEATHTSELVEVDQAGFRFVPADEWRIEKQGTVTELESRDGHGVMAIGPGPDGSASTASDRLLDLIESNYADVQVLSEAFEPIDHNPAVVLKGSASNEDGVRLRFVGVVIEGLEDNLAITVFSARSPRAAERLASAESMISSMQLE